MLVCSVTGSGKSFKAQRLDSAHPEGKNIEVGEKQRSEKQRSRKKTGMLNKTQSFLRLLLRVRRSVMRAWENKACRSLFLVMLITSALSPGAASLPDPPASFHSCFSATQRAPEHPTVSVSDHCLPQQPLSALGRKNGWRTGLHSPDGSS